MFDPDNLLLTQAPTGTIFVRCDGNIIVELYYYYPLNYILVYTTVAYVCYVFFWWLCMAINISVQYNGGLLPDIILLTQWLLPSGNPFK